MRVDRYRFAPIGAVWLVLATTAQGQVVDQRWSEPWPLSRPDAYAADSVLIPDPYGHLHAFWIQSGLPNRAGHVGYARFDGSRWSEPIAIAELSDADCNHRSVSAAVDAAGFLHAVWTAGINGPTRYARVAIAHSTDATQWTRPLDLRLTAYRLDLQIDAAGTLHLLHTRFYDQDPGVYYTRSTDNGWSWKSARRIDRQEGQAPYFIRAGIDAAGGLHAVWHYYIPDKVLGQEVRYAYSRSGGKKWSKVMTLATPGPDGTETRMANPNMAVTGMQVHVVWSGGAPGKTFRVHRYSTDAGVTWSEPQRIFGQLHGQAHGDGLAVDGAGRVHFTGQIRWPQGVYHAYWADGAWSAPVMLYRIALDADDPIGDRIHAHYVRLGIRAGNQLITTFTSLPPPAKRLHAMHTTLEDLGPLPLLAVPPPPPFELSRAFWIWLTVLAIAGISTVRHWRQSGGAAP